MKNLKRVIAVACMLALTLTLFTGFGAFAKTAGNVTIAFWEQDDANAQKILDGMIKDFMAKNPGITVKRSHYETEDLRKNYTAASLGTTGPDIVLGPNDNLGVFVTGDLIAPADQVMGKDFFKVFDQSALVAAKYQGQQYMIPDRNGNELILAYNKKLVSKAPATFEELISISKQLKAAKKVEYGLVFNEVEPFFTIPFLKAFGGEVFDNLNSKSPKPTLNTKAVADWMAFMAKLHDDGIIPKEADYDVANNLFKQGKAAFIINGPWGFSDYQAAKINFGLSVIPKINGKYPAPMSAVKGYTISKSVLSNPAKKDAVKKFLAFVNSGENQVKMVAAHNQLPTVITAIKNPKIAGNKLISAQGPQLAKCVPMPTIPQMRAIWDAIKPIQQQVFAGKVKPADAPALMQKKAEEGIESLGL